MKSIRQTVGLISLMTFCPALSLLLWYTATTLDGSFFLLYKIIEKHGLLLVIYEIWAPLFFGSKVAWIAILSFFSFQLLLLKIVPGKSVTGLQAENGYTPQYKNNGLLSYAITIITYVSLSYGCKLFSPTLIFDHFGEMIASLSLLAFFLSLGLYLKGRYAPTSSDRAITKNPVYDFYWGVELYPRVLHIEVKQFLKSRFAMMSWPLILISFALAQSNIYGLTNSLLISIGLQFLYITNFFCWESNRLQSIDVTYDRSGFYIVWATLGWIPVAYTSPTLYLIYHPNQLSPITAFTIFALGSMFIIVHYLIDWQKVHFTIDNKKESLLITSRLWGLSRHFHYLPALLISLIWSLPALFSHFFPYFYVAYLALYYFDRARKDELYYQSRYGESWEKYCKQVPYKIIPFIF